jgi:ribosomal protein L37AE/L43A
MNDNILFYADGAKELAKSLKGNEKVETGIRPYAFHAGNRASLIGLPYILCEEIAKLDKKVELDFHITFADTEQRVLVGTDIANLIFDTRPLDTTIQFSKEPDDESTTKVWGEYIKNEFCYIQKHFPFIKANFYYCSDLYKTNPVFKHLITKTMSDQQQVKNIMLKASGRQTDNSNTSFALSVCPDCKDTHTNTNINGGQAIVQCDKCGKISVGGFSDFDYWLHHSISSLGSWEIFPQNNIVILGLDHYLYKDDSVRNALYRYFFNKETLTKRCLYSSLVVDDKGDKMGKSSKNYFDVSNDEVLDTLRKNSNSKHICLQNKIR